MKLNSRYCLTAISALLRSCVSVETYAEKNTFATDSLNIKKETVDTVVGKTLKEIVVEGQSQYVTSEGLVFMPDEKTRKMASNGLSLLDMMANRGRTLIGWKALSRQQPTTMFRFSSITSLPAPPRCVGFCLRMYAV